MFCCSECFLDVEIKAIIESRGIKGHCDFCGKEDVFVYEIGPDAQSKDTTLADMFDNILDVYTPRADLPTNFPREQTELIKNILRHDWNIFNSSAQNIYRLITKICAERYRAQPELFDEPVGIREILDLNYLKENKILKEYCWDDFAKGIKCKNRFHSDYIKTDRLLTFLRYAEKNYHQGAFFYRVRICPDKIGYKPKDMGAPPLEKAKGGRVNPEGIRILYLSNDENTTLYEVRAGIYDYVSIGRFELLKDIKIIDLAGIDRISPFLSNSSYGDFDFLQYALNIEDLKMLAAEIAKPLRNDNALDYIPTQYISDFIRSNGYDGIQYKSTMNFHGINVAIFDPDLLECKEAKVYNVKSISYDYEPV